MGPTPLSYHSTEAPTNTGLRYGHLLKSTSSHLWTIRTRPDCIKPRKRTHKPHRKLYNSKQHLAAAKKQMESRSLLTLLHGLSSPLACVARISPFQPSWSLAFSTTPFYFFFIFPSIDKIRENGCITFCFYMNRAPYPTINARTQRLHIFVICRLLLPVNDSHCDSRSTFDSKPSNRIQTADELVFMGWHAAAAVAAVCCCLVSLHFPINEIGSASQCLHLEILRMGCVVEQMCGTSAHF